MDSQSGDLMVLTDLEEVVPLLKKNMLREFRRRMEKRLSGAEIWAKALTWGNEGAWRRLYVELSAPLEGPLREVTHILCSDVVSAFPIFTEN